MSARHVRAVLLRGGSCLVAFSPLPLLAVAPVAGAWTWPADGPVLQAFVFDPASPYAAGSIAASTSAATPAAAVLAPATGTVTFAGTVPSSGKSRHDHDARRVRRHADASRLARRSRRARRSPRATPSGRSARAATRSRRSRTSISAFASPRRSRVTSTRSRCCRLRAARRRRRTRRRPAGYLAGPAAPVPVRRLPVDTAGRDTAGRDTAGRNAAGSRQPPPVPPAPEPAQPVSTQRRPAAAPDPRGRRAGCRVRRTQRLRLPRLCRQQLSQRPPSRASTAPVTPRRPGAPGVTAAAHATPRPRRVTRAVARARSTSFAGASSGAAAPALSRRSLAPGGPAALSVRGRLGAERGRERLRRRSRPARRRPSRSAETGAADGDARPRGGAVARLPGPRRRMWPRSTISHGRSRATASRCRPGRSARSGSWLPSAVPPSVRRGTAGSPRGRSYDSRRWPRAEGRFWWRPPGRMRRAIDTWGTWRGLESRRTRLPVTTGSGATTS